MKHIRTKLTLSLLVVSLVPLVPSYYLVRGLVDRSFELGFNDTVGSAIESAATLSRQLYARHRVETMVLAAPLADSPQVLSLLAGQDSAAAATRLHAEAAALGRYALDLYDNDGVRRVSLRELPDSLLQVPLPQHDDDDAPAGDLAAQFAEEALGLTSHTSAGVPIEVDAERLVELAPRSEPSFLETGNDPGYVAIHLPVRDPAGRRGSLLIARRTPEEFPRPARHIMAVNQLFKSVDYYKEDLRRLFVGVFLFFYGVLALLAVAVGYVFSRRITSPLLRLVQGTHEVAAGDLDYRIEVHSEDEIGQLMSSFNRMIEAIRENQRLAREREQARQQAAAESARHESDLEVAQLRTRALEAENERKNVELAKGQELERAYQELEESHRRLQEAQAQLLLQEKMATLGTVVAGFAHEINNPMGAVHSATDVARRCVRRLRDTFAEAEPDASSARTLGILEQNLRVIDEAEERVTRLVDSLRNFGRLDEAELQMADLHEGLDSALHLLGQLLGTRIAVDRDYGDIPRTFCAPAQINQVFMSVLRNAVRAIDGEGRIHIHTGVDADGIHVRIRDSGCGIAPAQLKRIFDLQFTAGASRVKLGSGLSMAYRILQEHEGDLRIDSTLGEGTEVTMVLPVRQANHRHTPAGS